MLKRDFSKPVKQYFNKNKFVLIGVLAFFLLAIIIGAIFGMNGNFEFKNHQQFAVRVSGASAKSYVDDVQNIVNKAGGKFDSYQIFSSGDNTQIVVRYNKLLSEQKQQEINDQIEALSKDNIQLKIIKTLSSTGHETVGKVVNYKHYTFTAVSILILLVAAIIFAYIRYNGASAIAILFASLFATAGYIAVGAILRLTIGQSYFAMLVALNVLTIYCTIMLFENIRSTNWLVSEQYDMAIDEGIKKSKLRLFIISIALFVAGLLFVIIAPNSIKYISINLLFMAVTLLAVMLYVVPFVWNIFIPYRKKAVKIKKESK